MALNELAEIIRINNVEKGFILPSNIETDDNAKSVIVALALIVTEVSEAIEAVRICNNDQLKEELADIIIRTLDLAEALGFDIAEAIEDKIELNRQRPYKHGKKF